MKKHIICCPGSINPDLKLKTNANKGVKTFFGRYFEDLGGKGCDTCVAIKNVCGDERKVFLVGCIGSDSWADYCMEKLIKKNIETDFIFRKEGRTGIVLENIYGNGAIDVGIEPGANMKLSVKDVIAAEDIIKNSALVIGQIENPIECLECSFALAKKYKIPTLLDPSVVPTDKEKRKFLFEKIMPIVDILMPDRYELQQLTGIKPANRSNLIKASKNLLNNCKILCITLGSNGVYISNRKQYKILPAYKVKAVDGGGVGDTFRGLFGLKIIEYCEKNNQNIESIPFEYLIRSARYASAGSAIAISRLGTIEAIPTKQEIEEFLKNRNF